MAIEFLNMVVLGTANGDASLVYFGFAFSSILLPRGGRMYGVVQHKALETIIFVRKMLSYVGKNSSEVVGPTMRVLFPGRSQST